MYQNIPKVSLHGPNRICHKLDGSQLVDTAGKLEGIMISLIKDQSMPSVMANNSDSDQRFATEDQKRLGNDHVGKFNWVQTRYK